MNVFVNFFYWCIIKCSQYIIVEVGFKDLKLFILFFYMFFIDEVFLMFVLIYYFFDYLSLD